MRASGSATVTVTDNSDYNEGSFINKFEETIEDTACPSSSSTQSCKANVLKINDEIVNDSNVRGRHLLWRELSSSLLVEFELIIEAICSSNSDCSDFQEVEDIANEIYDQIGDDLRDAINDGSFATLLEQAVVAGNFSDLVVPLLSSLAKWYPQWNGSSNTCKNDGYAPMYMKVFGFYYEKSLDACCGRFFSWDFYTCMGGSASLPSGLYPNWGHSDSKCLDSTDNSSGMPDYMQRNPGEWLYDDIESCCDSYYHFDFDNCLVNSGGDPSAAYTNKWYVDHQDQSCHQDCQKSDVSTCGGKAHKWQTLHENPDACCEDELSWISTSVCVAQSTGSTAVGTSLWFVDWELDQCVKDCDISSDIECGGFAKSWDQLYSSASDCCSRLWWIERSKCML